jgi:hypothetical protein
MTKPKTWWADLASSLDEDWPPQDPITGAELCLLAYARREGGAGLN